MLEGNWNYPTSIRFGAGRVAELPHALAELGITKPLLITDAGLAKLPVLDLVKAPLEAASIPFGVYANVKGNPEGEHVMGGVTVMRDGDYDGVIALGGGSALDVAKAVALMWKQTHDLFDFEDRGDNWTRVDPQGVAPVVAIPTTSGTGSEVGRASVITDASDHTKKILFHPTMLPGKVIADPALTVGLPPHLTAATGIDALSHNLEAYCAPGFHPQADGIAAEGIRLIDVSLLAAMEDGHDLDARARMMAASLMGATAFQKGLGAMHSLAHVIGARTDAHHGLLNAIVMPYVLAFNREAIDDRLAELARSMGLDTSFDAFQAWVLELREKTGIPHTLEGIVQPADVRSIAAAPVHSPSTLSHPVAMAADGFDAILLSALSGTVG